MSEKFPNLFGATKGISNWLGNRGEQKAKHYLKQQGLEFITQNYRCRTGEIDLIMRDNAVLVFVEVKYRQTTSHGGAVEYFHQHKRKKVEKALAHYLHQHDMNPAHTECRIDLVAIQGSKIEWLKNV